MKFGFKKMIDLLKLWLTKDFDFKKTLICSATFLLSFSLLFPAGALSSKTVDEVCADYYVDIAKNHTNTVSAKQLSGLIVEPKDESKAKTRQDTENAITELWGVFKGNNASFAPVINANRNYNINFSDGYEEYGNDNLSLVYTNAGQSSEPYHTKTVNGRVEEIYDYKFQSSPIALMFPSGVGGMQDKLHIFISQSQAERKLLAEGKEITKDNLKELQWQTVQMSIDGTICDCIIDNIYLDNFKHVVEQPRNPNTGKIYDYYYATDIGTVLGDFVFVVFTHLKSGVFPDGIKRGSLYMMSEYSFRNKFYLEYAKDYYSPENFIFDYARTNLKDGFNPDNNILQRSLYASSFDVFCVLTTILFIFAFLVSIFIIYRSNLFKQPLSLLIVSSASLIPYLLFKIIFVFSNNTYIFSSYSLVFNLILFVVFALAVFIMNCFGREVKTEETK